MVLFAFTCANRLLNRCGGAAVARCKLSLLIVLCCSYAQAQLWSGIIAPSRAVNWQNAGVPASLPSRTTQCGSTIAPYGSSSSPAAATTINNAIASCPVGDFVSLGAGTFYLSSGITFGSTNNVTVRGQGANQTFIVMSGESGCQGTYSAVCISGSTNYPNGEQNVCDWTAGYSAGTTTITLGNCGSTTPAVGSLSNLHVGSIMVLDQLDAAQDNGQIWNCSGDNYPCLGGPTSFEGGGARNDGTCLTTTVIGTLCERSQQQVVVVTGISGSSVTFSPGLYMPNWSNGQLPQAWFPNTTIVGDGVEDISFNLSSATGTTTVVITDAYECWVRGIRSITPSRDNVEVLIAKNITVDDNYFYGAQSSGSVSYGNEFDVTSDSLLANNICQQITLGCYASNGGAEGLVVAYNFTIDNYFGSSGANEPAFLQHAAGDAMDLFEGNCGNTFSSDTVHGTHHFNTLFRDLLQGSQNAGCGSAGPENCNNNTTAVEPYAGSRYFNVVGNVLGDPGRTQITVYQYEALTGDTHSCAGSGGCYAVFTVGYPVNAGWSSGNGSVVDITATAVSSGTLTVTGANSLSGGALLILVGTGESCLNGQTITVSSPSATQFSATAPAGCSNYTNSSDTGTASNGYSLTWCSSPACSSFVDYDPQTVTSLMRWGNWDTITNAVRWCGNSSDTGWTATCGSASEIPASLAAYSNPVPSYGDIGAGQNPMAASFFYSSPPSWWPFAKPWPLIGPDVTNGNIGICSGGTYAGALATNASQCAGGTLATEFGGHANSNPAMDCYLTTMGGPPDGSGSVLSFNAATCYNVGSGTRSGPTAMSGPRVKQ